MKQLRIQCVDCGKPVIVSAFRPCFYCGRNYSQQEVDSLFAQNKGEVVDVEELLSARGPLAVEPVQPRSPPWRNFIYVAAALFFLIFCAVCILLILKLK